MQGRHGVDLQALEQAVAQEAGGLVERGGRGKQATATKEDEFVEHMFVANSHDYILCFSSKGRVYWLKVYEIPEGSRTAKGKAVVNLVNVGMDEKITTILPVKEFSENTYLFMATRNGA